MPVIHVPEILRDKLGPEGAEALVRLLDQTGRETREEVVLLAQERFRRQLTEAFAALETRLTERMAAMETRLDARFTEGWQAMAGLETRLTERLAAVEGRLIRWSFAFWTTQFVLLLGVLFAFFK